MQRKVSTKEIAADEILKIKEIYPDVSSVVDKRIVCTVCFKDLKCTILLKKKCYVHPILKVIVCKKCCKFYGNGEFSVDDDGSDKYCRWCGQGGNLYLCSKCPSAFCPTCIKKNLDRNSLLDVRGDNWKCLICHPIPIFKLRALTWAVVAHLNNLKQNKLTKAANSKARPITPKGQLKKTTTTTPKRPTFPDISFSEEPNGLYLGQAREYLNDFGSNCDKFLEDTRGKLKELSSKDIKTFDDLKRVYISYLELMNLSSGAFSGFADTMINYLSTWKKIVEEASTQKVSEGVEQVEENKLDEVITNYNDDGITPDLLTVTPDISVSNDKSRLDSCSQELEKSSKTVEPVGTESLVHQERKPPTIRVRNLSELMPTPVTIDLSSSESDKEDARPVGPERKTEESAKQATKILGKSEENVKSTHDRKLTESPEQARKADEREQTEKPEQARKADERKQTESSEQARKANGRMPTKSTEQARKAEKPSKKKDCAKVTKNDSSFYTNKQVDGKVTKVSPNLSHNEMCSVIGTLDDSSSSDPLSSGSSDDDDVRQISKRGRASCSDDAKKSSKKNKLEKTIKTRKKAEKIFSSSSEDDLEKMWRFTSLENRKKSSTVNKSKTTAPKKKEPEPSLSDLAESVGSGDSTPSVNEDSGEELSTLLGDTFDEGISKKTPQVSDILKEVLEMSSEASSELSNDEENYQNNVKKGSSKKLKRGNKGYSDTILSAKFDLKKTSKKKGARNIIESSDSEGEDAPKTGKKTKNKKLFSDSDVSSLGLSDKEEKSADSEDSLQPIKKKRRIAKRAASSDSSDSENKSNKNSQETSVKGRKNIKKIIGEKSLKDTTKEALALEKERKERIAEKQRLYNELIRSHQEEHKELSEVVLDFDAKTKEKLLCVHPDLVKKLKPHQAEGIKFMWDACFESIELAKKKKGSGCILAHCMGLGKTLQVVTLLHTLLTQSDVPVNTALVICPFSTVLNWVNEFQKWLSDIGSGEDLEIYHLTKIAVAHRASTLREWQRTGGVMIMGYNMFRTLTGEKGKAKKSCKLAFKETLLDPGPDIVVCDEGHMLKNEATALSICTNKIRSARRIVLTGTPLQNNLIEYHCMVQFIKPNLLGTKKEFKNRFVNPITNGQFEDSTPRDVKIMKRRAHVLHTMLDGLVQRKDYNVLTPYLPPKYEYVIHLKLSELQILLYRTYLEKCTNEGTERKLFADFQNLLWICLHPRSLLMKSEKDEKKALLRDESDEEGSLKEFIDDSDDSKSSEFRSSTTSSDNDSSNSKSGSNSRSTQGDKKARRTRKDGSPDVEIVSKEKDKEWWADLVTDDQLEDIKQSTKMFMFFSILKLCEEIGDKLLVFSQSLYTLDIIEYFLNKVDISTQADEPDPGCAGFTGSWCRGLDYYRLDGGTNSENRDKFCKSFNDLENVRSRLFLISTRAGGLGINLTGANRVIIFDASWNPSYDVQSLFRVFRFGQAKPCYIYRFLSKGTMEEKIYERQVAKLSTSLRVVDEQQIERHFSHSSMAELYSFSPEQDVQETPVLPKDRLMAELFQSHKDLILAHHQHDSLLENKEEEELTEEERKAAWADFEQEKANPMINAPGGFVGISQGINNLNQFLLQIQQALRESKPHLTQEEVRIQSLKIVENNPTFKQLYASAFGSDVYSGSMLDINRQLQLQRLQDQMLFQQQQQLMQQQQNQQRVNNLVGGMHQSKWQQFPSSSGQMLPRMPLNAAVRGGVMQRALHDNMAYPTVGTFPNFGQLQFERPVQRPERPANSKDRGVIEIE